MYKYRLNDLEFKDGTTIQLANLTVIVGANNAGKSRSLKDIVNITTINPNQEGIVVKNVNWSKPASLSELRESYDIDFYQNENGVWTSSFLKPDLTGEHNATHGMLWPSGFEQSIRAGDFRSFVQVFGKAMVAFLTTESRLQIVKQSPSPARANQTANLLQILYNGNRADETEISAIIKNAFGKEIALDFTILRNLQIRVGSDFSSLPQDPRDARPVMLKHDSLDDQGDGIRSFTGIAIALLSIKRNVFLIDEPEAFLHPPQAFRIGEFIAEHANSDHQIILATHSADVLRGILSKTHDMTILRMSRTATGNSIRRLESEQLKQLTIDPLLSSARVFEGLFYSGAVVVEADSDARFYHAVSKKMRPDLDLHFVNADNKQTVPRILKLYRQMGIPCAGIVDFDVLNEKVEFMRQMTELEIPSEKIDSAISDRETIAKAANEQPADERLQEASRKLDELTKLIVNHQNDASLPPPEKLLKRIESKCREIAETTKSWKTLKEKGVEALSGNTKDAFDRIWKITSKEGLFINPTGELESMLREYGVEFTSDKRAWIHQALQLLSGLQVDESKNPWRFMRQLHDFLSPLTPDR